jgi:hypothetical protein
MLAIVIFEEIPAHHLEIVGAVVGTLLLAGILLHVRARLSSPSAAALSGAQRREKWCGISYWLIFVVGPTIVVLWVTQSAIAFLVFAVLALGLPKARFLHRFWWRLWKVKTSIAD